MGQPHRRHLSRTVPTATVLDARKALYEVQSVAMRLHPGPWSQHHCVNASNCSRTNAAACLVHHLRFQGCEAVSARMTKVWRSLAGIPLWIQLWLVVLAGTNLASLVFLDTAAGRWTAAAFTVVGVFNLPLVVIQGGLTRLLSFTHLVWVPLLFVLIRQLIEPDFATADTATRFFVMAVVAVNGISLALDVVEMWRWSRGEREVLGL